ncbi:MAG TPA: tail fiber domain-containing protein, partial [Candidatus Acidoferrum sp.]|nr:tail fiber domain-containing protein [Candidatus Acidoferrum sp.]
GGGIQNTVNGTGSVIGGGGADGTVSWGNQIQQANAATIGGGVGNQIPNGGFYGVIGGGKTNNNAGNAAVIGGGLNNAIQATANDSTIGGGMNNLIDANSASAIFYNGVPFQGAWATVSGGWSNTIQSAGSLIGGGFYNVIDAGSKSFVIFPSGQNNLGGWSVIAGGAQNTNSSTASFIGGGGFNDIQAPAYWSVICGGEGNIIDTNSYVPTLGDYGIENMNNLSGGFSVIVGGAENKVRADSSFIGGGAGNLIDLGQVSSFVNPIGASFIGGGQGNSISNSAFSVISGGSENAILPDAPPDLAGGISTIAGGGGNKIFAIAGYGFIGGGSDNTINTNGTGAVIAGGAGNRANGPGAVIPGGENNFATGQDSFAAGNGAMATNDFSFVWAGGPDALVQSSSGGGQFIIGAPGGVAINTQPGTNDNGSGTIPFDLTVGPGGISTPFINILGSFNCNFLSATNGISTQGGISAYDGVFATDLTAFGTVYASGFESVSDRNLKDHFKPVNPVEILDQVASLPITRWNFKADEKQRHIGPMAQDFYAAFNVGSDDRHISNVDEGGVALAAIQGLNEKLNEKDAEIRNLKQQNNALASQLKDLAAAVKSLQEKDKTESETAKRSQGI